MKTTISPSEKLLRKSRALAYQWYYLWLASNPDVRATMYVNKMKYKIKK